MQMRAGVAKKTIRSVRQQAFEATHLFDSHPESSLDFEKVRAAVKDGYDKPFLLIDSAIVREKTRRFTAAMPRVLPHYAVKANPDPRVLKLMLEEGAGFEIASIAELDLLIALGVPAADVFYSNPVKSRDQIAYAASRGVQWYVIDSVEVIGEVVNRALDAFPAAVRVIAEPGRFLVSDAGYFVCRIMGTAIRATKRWMHLDAGLFGGIIETAEGLKYKIRTDRSGPDIPWNVAGPTCDSIDVVMRDEPLPSDLQEGDYIYLRNAGAYTTAYASGFNGFPLPEIRVI